MSAWTVVPCLLALRTEFNLLNPKRDKGADGTIGDTAHTSASDHTPDEDSSVLRDHDADSKNEVHALDIDSTGPWPTTFNALILALVAREKREYESANIKARLKYVIWNRRIASRSNGWVWREYTGSDPHTNHAHFSALYTTDTENDTRSWGVAPVAKPTAPAQEDDVTEAELIAAVTKALQSSAARSARIDALRGWTEEDPLSTSTPKAQARVGGWIRSAEERDGRRAAALSAEIAKLAGQLAEVQAKLSQLTERPPVVIGQEELQAAVREVLRDGVA